MRPWAWSWSWEAQKTQRRFLEGYRTADRHRHGGRQVLLDMRGVFAKFETNLRRERQLEGIAKAKAAGVYRGRSAPIDAPQVRAMKAQRFGGLGPRRSRRLSTSAGRPCMGIGGGAITGAGAKAPGWRPLIIPCYRRATALHCQQSNAPLRPALKKRRWDRNAQSSATSQARASHSRHHDGTAGKRVVLVRSWRARHSSRCNSAGSFAMLAAIRRASSSVRTLACRRPATSAKPDPPPVQELTT